MEFKFLLTYNDLSWLKLHLNSFAALRVGAQCVVVPVKMHQHGSYFDFCHFDSCNSVSRCHQKPLILTGLASLLLYDSCLYWLSKLWLAGWFYGGNGTSDTHTHTHTHTHTVRAEAWLSLEVVPSLFPTTLLLCSEVMRQKIFSVSLNICVSSYITTKNPDSSLALNFCKQTHALTLFGRQIPWS